METIRVNLGNIKIAAFKKWLALYGKSTSEKYVIELLFFSIGFAIYKGKTKPLFRNLYLINVFYFPFWLIAATIFSILWVSKIYLLELVDTFTADYIDVGIKIFNFVNVSLVIILTILLILKW